MRNKYLPVLLALIALPLFIGITSARESYEDYLEQRYKKEHNQNDVSVKRDKPLSEIRPGEREELLDDLRGAVRDEIDQTISKERKASKKSINQTRLVADVRRIVKEEIEDAIRLKQRKYLKAGTVEIGGFLSYQAKGVDSDEEDNNNILKVFPQLSVFIGNNIALALKGEAEFNLTNNTQTYYGGAGPQFVFGITKKDDLCFYADMMAGVSRNSEVNDKIGYRYSNGFGLKFVLTSGVIFNMGVQLVFDNLGENVSGFQNIIVPTVGITAWF